MAPSGGLQPVAEEPAEPQPARELQTSCGGEAPTPLPPTALPLSAQVDGPLHGPLPAAGEAGPVADEGGAATQAGPAGGEDVCGGAIDLTGLETQAPAHTLFGPSQRELARTRERRQVPARPLRRRRRMRTRPSSRRVRRRRRRQRRRRQRRRRQSRRLRLRLRRTRTALAMRRKAAARPRGLPCPAPTRRKASRRRRWRPKRTRHDAAPRARL